MSSKASHPKVRALRRKAARGVHGNVKGVSRRAASSPVAPSLLWTASGQKLALAKPQQTSAEHSVSSRDSADGACSSDSSSEMKGLWLIDIRSLLASGNRRASCNVCSSPFTVKENLKFRKGLCTEISLSCTNLLCAGSDDFFQILVSTQKL